MVTQGNGRANGRRRLHRAFVAFERFVLGIGMSVVAWFIERRLIAGLKKGGVTPAPRTAEEREEFVREEVAEPDLSREVGLATAGKAAGEA